MPLLALNHGPNEKLVLLGYEPPEDAEASNVGMGAALCRRSAPHKA
jgi:hypothetical protein